MERNILQYSFSIIKILLNCRSSIKLTSGNSFKIAVLSKWGGLKVLEMKFLENKNVEICAGFREIMLNFICKELRKGSFMSLNHDTTFDGSIFCCIFHIHFQTVLGQTEIYFHSRNLLLFVSMAFLCFCSFTEWTSTFSGGSDDNFYVCFSIWRSRCSEDLMGKITL